MEGTGRIPDDKHVEQDLAQHAASAVRGRPVARDAATDRRAATGVGRRVARRAGAGPAWRVARHHARMRGHGPMPRAVGDDARVPTPLTIASVAALIAHAPAPRVFAAAFALALLVHAGLGRASSSLRPMRAARLTPVAMEAATLPDDDLPPDPVEAPRPPPPPSTPPRSSLPRAVTPASLSQPASSNSTSGPPSVPGLAGVAGGAPGFGAVGGAGGEASAWTSTAQASQPTRAPEIVPARARARAAPTYPPRARRDGVSGQVTLALHVDETGVVRAVQIVLSDPAGVFDDAAITAARSFTFEPARAEGRAVASWVRQTIRFALE